ncbi:hypothetical protein [Serratia microhaemolytica]|uniref:hypothetical protein n=1 Tax=Serratia microhaemolytica TaxID=2675110 RepID=UPI000FDDA826|nr:hypothetical protein [Serratia microhaemolytica]
MSKWDDKYQDYMISWNELVEYLNSLDSISNPDISEEFERIKRIINYLDELLKIIDPELVKFSCWDEWKGVCKQIKIQFNRYSHNMASREILQAGHLVEQLLSQMQIYSFTDSKSISNIRKSTTTAVRQLKQSYEQMNGEINEIRKDLVDNKKRMDDLLSDIILNQQQSNNFKNEIEQFHSISNKNNQAITACYNDVFLGDENSPGIKHSITEAHESILRGRDHINSNLREINSKIDEIKEFHVKIFGSGDNSSDGLEKSLDSLKKELEKFQEVQKERYLALNQQIESLLPGATAAGLASAYHEMKHSFDQSIKKSSWLFYCSIIIFILGSVYLSIDSIGGESWIKFVALEDWSAIFKRMIYKLPLFGAVVWLALYALRRRSEAQRLQQEYAHKEALAKSYHSYKQQLEELDSSDTAMLKDLINKAIDSIAYNAAKTLDGKHGDQHPSVELLEKLLDKTNEKLTSPKRQ